MTTPKPQKKTPVKTALRGSAAVPRFAHLQSLPAPRADDGEDDEDQDDDKRKRAEGESDEDYNARMAKLDEDEKAAEDDEKEKEAAAFARGFDACNERWATVMSAPEVVGKMELACTLLADTDMDAAKIVKALTKAAPARAETSLARRMASIDAATPKPDTTPEAAKAGDAKSVAAMMVAAADRARGEKKAA